MNSDINLLYSKQKGQLGRLTRKVKLFRFLALGLLSFVTFASVIVFILVLASPLPQLKQEETALETQLSSQQAKITKYTLLIKRLNEANMIINKRPQHDKTLSQFEKDIPSTVLLYGFNAEQNIIKLKLSSLSLDNLQSYMSTLETLTQKKLAKQVVLSSMTTDSEIGYIVDVTIIL